jgi:hypothetical protein
MKTLQYKCKWEWSNRSNRRSDVLSLSSPRAKRAGLPVTSLAHVGDPRARILFIIVEAGVPSFSVLRSHACRASAGAVCFQVSRLKVVPEIGISIETIVPCIVLLRTVLEYIVTTCLFAYLPTSQLLLAIEYEYVHNKDRTLYNYLYFPSPHCRH